MFFLWLQIQIIEIELGKKQLDFNIMIQLVLQEVHDNDVLPTMFHLPSIF